MLKVNVSHGESFLDNVEFDFITKAINNQFFVCSEYEEIKFSSDELKNTLTLLTFCVFVHVCLCHWVH